MSSCNLIRLRVNMRALHRFGVTRGFGKAGGLDEGATLHHLLGESFGPGALQPFRLLVARGERSGTLYGYSLQSDQVLRDMAETVAPPEALEALDIGALAALPRPTHLFTVGKRLGFDVKLRPTVRLRKPVGGARAGAERDAFQAEAERDHPDQRSTMKKSERGRADVYIDWLAARLGKAATLECGATRLASFQRVRSLRGGKVIEDPEAIIHGTLRITDPVVFLDLMKRGVGRHRAYGYGMVLLRPPQRC